MSILSLGPYTRHQLETLFNTTPARHRDRCQAVVTPTVGSAMPPLQKTPRSDHGRSNTGSMPLVLRGSTG
jgi:hypothetical protein